MVASLVAFVVLTATGTFDPVDPLDGAYLMLATTAITTVAWLGVTFLTAPTPEAKLIAFYRRVRPGGVGWRSVARAAGLPDEPMAGGVLSWTNWVAGVVSVYAALFGTGQLIFGRYVEAVLFLGLAVLAFGWIAHSLRQERLMAPAEVDAAAPSPVAGVNR